MIAVIPIVAFRIDLNGTIESLRLVSLKLIDLRGRQRGGAAAGLNGQPLREGKPSRTAGGRAAERSPDIPLY